MHIIPQKPQTKNLWEEIAAIKNHEQQPLIWRTNKKWYIFNCPNLATRCFKESLDFSLRNLKGREYILDQSYWTTLTLYKK